MIILNYHGFDRCGRLHFQSPSSPGYVISIVLSREKKKERRNDPGSKIHAHQPFVVSISDDNSDGDVIVSFSTPKKKARLDLDGKSARTTPPQRVRRHQRQDHTLVPHASEIKCLFSKYGYLARLLATLEEGDTATGAGEGLRFGQGLEPLLGIARFNLVDGLISAGVRFDRGGNSLPTRHRRVVEKVPPPSKNILVLEEIFTCSFLTTDCFSQLHKLCGCCCCGAKPTK